MNDRRRSHSNRRGASSSPSTSARVSSVVTRTWAHTSSAARSRGPGARSTIRSSRVRTSSGSWSTRTRVSGSPPASASTIRASASGWPCVLSTTDSCCAPTMPWVRRNSRSSSGPRLRNGNGCSRPVPAGIAEPLRRRRQATGEDEQRVRRPARQQRLAQPPFQRGAPLERVDDRHLPRRGLADGGAQPRAGQFDLTGVHRPHGSPGGLGDLSEHTAQRRLPDPARAVHPQDAEIGPVPAEQTLEERQLRSPPDKALPALSTQPLTEPRPITIESGRHRHTLLRRARRHVIAVT